MVQPTCLNTKKGGEVLYMSVVLVPRKLRQEDQRQYCGWAVLCSTDGHLCTSGAACLLSVSESSRVCR